MKKILLMATLVVNPALFASEAIGFYSKGQLQKAQSVFEHGTAIHKLFVARKRLYTTDEMHKVLTDASDFLHSTFPEAEVLQVGDLSLKDGGLAEGHASHQNGLDADIVYLRNNGYVQPAESKSWEEDFVLNQSPSKNFNLERNFSLFKHFVKSAPVGRIFVDIALKRSLCEFAQKSGDLKKAETIQVLRRLRPANLHRTHFHLRLDCDPSDNECTKQSAPAEGAGCDELSLMLELATGENAC